MKTHVKVNFQISALEKLQPKPSSMENTLPLYVSALGLFDIPYLQKSYRYIKQHNNEVGCTKQALAVLAPESYLMYIY